MAREVRNFLYPQKARKSSNFSVNIKKNYPKKLRNVVLFFSSYLQCIYAVFFCFCTVRKLNMGLMMGLTLPWAMDR